jgi:hypothetical protein
MSQIDPLVFGAVVFALIGLAVFMPKIFAGPKGPTADDVFLDSLPSVYQARITVPAHTASPVPAVAQSEQPEATPVGAPRAISPTRQPVPTAPTSDAGLAPLRLPD